MPFPIEQKPELKNLPESFRRLYFHLYTNSKASRAERIMEDISLLLLLKLAQETTGKTKVVSAFLNGECGANESLIEFLNSAYPGLVERNQRFSIGDEAVKTALSDLNGIQLSKAPAHVLGEAFQALIGPRLRGDKGQFFTPRSLVRTMVEIIDPKPNESVLDPACGTGGFLVEAHLYQVKEGRAGGRLVGIDKDHDLFRLSSALMQIASQGRARICNFNSLDAVQWSDHFGNGEDQLFDVVLTNPPFGARIGLRDPELLQKFALGHQWIQSDGHCYQVDSLLGSQDPQILFLELCVRKLKNNGRLGIVLPEGIFGNKSESHIWHWLKTQGKIFALLDCPRTMFQPSTDTKTNVLFFQKASEDKPSTSQIPDHVRIAVALNCGHDRRGRTVLGTGKSHPDDLPEIARSFHRKSSEDNPWRNVRLRPGSYMVPRYYAEEKPLTDQESDLIRGAKIVTLQDLASAGILEIRKGHEVGSDAYGTGDVPFVRTSDLANFEISVDPTKSVAEEIYAEYGPQQNLKAGNILMVVDGRYRIGTTALLTENNCRCIIQSHLRVLSIIEKSYVDTYELLFSLNLPSVRLRIRDLVFVQSTLGTLGKRLLELHIPILHGEGPWQSRVVSFAETLRRRDQLLSELRAVNGTAYDV